MRQPKCQYFDSCGGCDTQHLEYELQLKNKLSAVSGLLDIPADKIQVFSGREFNYRNRMDFIFHKNGIGLRGKNPSQTIEIENCPISNHRINNILNEMRDFFKEVDAFDFKRRAGTFKFAIIRATRITSSISFVLNQDSANVSDACARIEEFSRTTMADNVIIGYSPKDNDASTADEFYAVKGTEYLDEEILGKRFRFHSQGFFQNNTEMAEKMAQYIRDVYSRISNSGINNNGCLLDLYGGVGLFGLNCSNLFKEITIADSASVSIECAKTNIISFNAGNAGALVLDARNVNKINPKRPLHVIADPPRTGMEQKALERLIALNPQTITYISCNPHQLGREVVQFSKAGYKIASCALFDLFPQTNHCEVVVHLAR